MRMPRQGSSNEKRWGRATLVVDRSDGCRDEVPLTLRVDTPIEVEYFRHGGILPYVLRRIAGMRIAGAARAGARGAHLRRRAARISRRPAARQEASPTSASAPAGLSIALRGIMESDERGSP